MAICCQSGLVVMDMIVRAAPRLQPGSRLSDPKDVIKSRPYFALRDCQSRSERCTRLRSADGGECALRSLHQYLVGVALLLVLLICAAAALVIYEVDRFARSQSEQQLLATTRALSLVVDG